MTKANIYSINVDESIEKLKSSSISGRNKELILSFVDECFIEGIGDHRIIKYVSVLKCIAQSMNKDFDKIDIPALKRYVITLERSDKSEWTKHDYKIAICKFYRWLYSENNPVLISWIKTSVKIKDLKLPEDMLTEHEVLLLINNASNRRDRAIIAMLWDLGARIGEILTLRVKDLTFDDIGLIIHLTGKTGPRRVRACWSVKYIEEWLVDHPENHNPLVPLFFKFNYKRKQLDFLKYYAFRNTLSKITAKSGINKRIHPHIFRHSRCTFMANHLTEAQMNNYFGWSRSSTMSSVYIHLSGRDVDAAILRANGMTIDIRG
ncbi:MAG: tyrosine-type recombinase/integrase [Methanomethylovorans sp.]|uniref:tyrosine-type recombinase/integrase n=1 Tax=Methanomethylovorans sp. TaxID=2758717 RepID=UPI0035309DD7